LDEEEENKIDSMKIKNSKEVFKEFTIKLLTPGMWFGDNEIILKEEEKLYGGKKIKIYSFNVENRFTSA
jgi:hypothetical protein